MPRHRRWKAAEGQAPASANVTASVLGAGAHCGPAAAPTLSPWGRRRRRIQYGDFRGATIDPSRGYSSAGRAPGSHPGGRRFEPA
jgi:hypothetical protein